MNLSHRTSRRRCRRQGTILIMTIVVCFALAGTVLALSRAMRVETVASANLAASIQASAVVRGAEQYLIALISQQAGNIDQLAESEFAAIPIGQGWFWVLRPTYDDDATRPLFGLVGESEKLNLNTASYEQLLRLPGMTEDAAASIMDWRDEDTNPERTGVETYYDAPEPYAAKNGPFETVEELLLVYGVDRYLLYGDGTAPPLGTSPSLRGNSVGGMMSDPQLARGIYDLVTVFSTESNTNASGQRRIRIDDNDRDMRRSLQERLRQHLSEERADAIVGGIGTDDMEDIFEFYRLAKNNAQMTPEEFDLIADELTTTNDRTLRGRINICTAPRGVLRTLDGLDESDVESLLSARPARGSGISTTPALAWVAEALGAEKAASARIGRWITTRSQQYSADILAVSGNGRAFKRVRLIIDARNATPTIRYRRDLTDRGWPMDTSVLASIRAGQGPGQFGTGFSGGSF